MKQGGLLTENPQEVESPYTFSDSPAYTRQKKREEALQVLERRTAVPSGLFLVSRAMLRWKFQKYHGALRDAEEALEKYGPSPKAGPLAAAFACMARICLGSEAP